MRSQHTTSKILQQLIALRILGGEAVSDTAVMDETALKGNIKFESASQLIDRMAACPNLYQGDHLRLFTEVAGFTDFTHLKRWDDSDLKIQKAKEKVAALRKHVTGHIELIEGKKEAETRKAKTIDYQSKLDNLKDRFTHCSPKASKLPSIG